MTTKTILLAAAAGAALAAPAGALADTWSSHRVEFATTEGRTTTGGSARFLVPDAWTVVRGKDANHASFRSGAAICRYSITFTTRIAPDSDETPAAHATAQLPVAGPAYVLDQGTRGTASAWRVTRLKTTDGRVRLRAMRADHRRLTADGRAWQETIVSAVSARGGECHSGTYRASLGPQIGTALASVASRIYRFTRRP